MPTSEIALRHIGPLDQDELIAAIDERTHHTLTPLDLMKFRRP